MMNTTMLELAITEADRFKYAARIVLATLKCKKETGPITGTAQTSACRRASMDLTRVLAQLRKTR